MNLFQPKVQAIGTLPGHCLTSTIIRWSMLKAQGSYISSQNQRSKHLRRWMGDQTLYISCRTHFQWTHYIQELLTHTLNPNVRMHIPYLPLLISLFLFRLALVDDGLYWVEGNCVYGHAVIDHTPYHKAGGRCLRCIYSLSSLIPHLRWTPILGLCTRHRSQNRWELSLFKTQKSTSP